MDVVQVPGKVRTMKGVGEEFEGFEVGPPLSSFKFFVFDSIPCRTERSTIFYFLPSPPGYTFSPRTSHFCLSASIVFCITSSRS